MNPDPRPQKITPKRTLEEAERLLKQAADSLESDKREERAGTWHEIRDYFNHCQEATAPTVTPEGGEPPERTRCKKCGQIFMEADGKQYLDGDVDVWCPKCGASDDFFEDAPAESEALSSRDLSSNPHDHGMVIEAPVDGMPGMSSWRRRTNNEWCDLRDELEASIVALEAERDQARRERDDLKEKLSAASGLAMAAAESERSLAEQTALAEWRGEMLEDVLQNAELPTKTLFRINYVLAATPAAALARQQEREAKEKK